MGEVHPEIIDQAANNVMSEPLAHMKVAKEYVEKDCQGHTMMLGAVGMPAVLSSYNPAYDAFLQTLNGGVDKLREMANGLSYTAAHWAHAEHANTPTGAKTDVQYKKPDEGSNAVNAFEFAGLYWGASLAVLQLASEGALAACGALSPAAVVALLAWALWTPDDAALTRVQNGWEAASGEVAAVIDQLDAALRPLSGAWEGTDDRHAFDVWLASFKTELRQTQDDLKAMADAIKTAHDNINDAQLKFFVFAAICLVMIIFYTALDGTPAAPIAEALKTVQSIMLNVSATATLTWFVQAFVFAIAAVAAGKDSFTPDIPGPSANAGGQGTGLQDIKIEWDDPYQAQYGH